MDASTTVLRRLPNGFAFREVGRGRPLLLLHGLMAAGEMFDPLVERAVSDIGRLPPSGKVRASLAAHAPYSVAPLFFRAIKKAVDRMPRARSPRNAVRSVDAHCADSDGSSAVMIETVKMAYGSWKNAYALM